MSDIHWIKLSVNMFKDDKIELIELATDGDTILVIWLKLLCLAGRERGDGIIELVDGLADWQTKLASLFRKSPEVLQTALHALEKLGMIEITDGKIRIVNWAKHQNVASLEKIRAGAAKRQKAHRDRLGYGENKRVLLTTEAYQRLCTRYGKSLADRYIEKVDGYCEAHEHVYSNYEQAVCNFIKMDVERGTLSETVLAPASITQDKSCPECGNKLYGSSCKCGWGASA